MRARSLWRWALLATLPWLASCGPQVNRQQAIYVLIDTSGTYAKELTKAQGLVNYLLATIHPGDSLAVGQVQSRSFSEKTIVAKVSLGKDPLAVNTQKRAFSQQFADFSNAVRNSGGSRYTDITGGVIQAAEYLNETQAGRKTLVIFSDMQEELDKQTQRNNIPLKLDGIHLVAVNVTKLSTDNLDPRRYLGRLEWWEQRARSAGAADWKVVNDMGHLDRIFKAH